MNLFKQFSPQILLWVLRIFCFVWAFALHTFQSLFVLTWLVHSLVVARTKPFALISLMFYLPVFALIFAFFYVINIPQVVP